MIRNTQCLFPGQYELHKEATRRLWKLCSPLFHRQLTCTLLGHLLHMSRELTCAPSQHTFPRVASCSLACAVGDVNARRRREDLPWPLAEIKKSRRSCCKKWQTNVCVGNQMLRFFYLPGPCDVKCRVSTVRTGARSGYAPRGVYVAAVSKVHFPLRKKQSSVMCN